MKKIKIQNQTWTTNNFDVSHYRKNDPILKIQNLEEEQDNASEKSDD